MKLKYIFQSVVFTLLIGAVTLQAGNPDRQGEAGAAELLLNPWARSAGLHSTNTASIMGVEAMRLNIAGLARISTRELVVSNTRLFSGSDVNMNALGFANKVGESGAFGISLVAMDFGEIPVTTTFDPEGTGGTFSPQFFNLGLGYSYVYDNKISVGLLVRLISESTADVSAFGFGIDAGVQYVTGPEDNFRLGISLRNVGSTMQFNGQGLATTFTSANGVELTGSQRSEDFELPSVLNIGLSYDFYVLRTSEDAGPGIGNQNLVVRAVGNFTSNAFSRDRIGGGVEVMFADKFTVRAAYRQPIGDVQLNEEDIYTGFAGGASVVLPFAKGSDSLIGLDYAYRATTPFQGTHNFSIRLAF